MEDETLVYDLESRETLCLDRKLAAVWTHCDGRTSIDDLGKLIAPLEKDAVRRDLAWISIEQLRAKGLLLRESVPAQNKFHGLSRREMLLRSGVFAAAMPSLMALKTTPNGAATLVCDCSAPAGLDARPQGCPCASNNDCCGNCNGGTFLCSASTGLGSPAACCPPPP